jgi:uncharacterized membrane protein
LVPKEEVVELMISVDDGLKLLMFRGAVVPKAPDQASELAPEQPKP